MPEIVGQLTYRGDIVDDVFYQVIGPDAAGSMVVPVWAVYDIPADRTVVKFAHATMDDVQAEMDVHGVPVPR